MELFSIRIQRTFQLVSTIYFRIMNTILFATDETELRASMERLKNETSLDEYFIFGYGAHHIWINQRRPSDKNRIFKNRIMVAHF